MALQMLQGYATTGARVRGSAAGRTIFAEAAKCWLGDEIGDAEAAGVMSAKLGTLVDIWLSLEK
jgi:5-dehydro-2-deoxygluconokinase